MAKQRPLSWAQQQYLQRLADGKWHGCSGEAINCSGLRGLMSRGLIERQENPNEHPWTWIRGGKFRLKPPAPESQKG